MIVILNQSVPCEICKIPCHETADGPNLCLLCSVKKIVEEASENFLKAVKGLKFPKPLKDPQVKDWKFYDEAPAAMISFMFYTGSKTMNDFWRRCTYPGWLIWILEREFSATTWDGEHGHWKLQAFVDEYREALEKANTGAEIVSIHSTDFMQPPAAERLDLCRRIRESFSPEGLGT